MFNLASLVGLALKRHKIDKEEIDQFYHEVHTSQSYAAALDVMERWVTVE